jgi:glycerol-3-phosphate O-acyltransferase
MILLDEPNGAIKWDEIRNKAKQIIQYCQTFKVPITDSILPLNLDKSLERSMDILIGNKKVEVIGNPTGQHVFYSIKEDSRKEILYFKNTILHHFLSPWIVHMALTNIFNGHIKTVEDLKKIFISQRKQLLHEFYLPTVKEFFNQALEIVSDAINREIKTLDECVELTHKELYLVLAKVGIFARSCNYLIEAYFISGVTLLDLTRDYESGFKLDTYLKRNKEMFEAEKKLKRFIKYSESYSVPLSKSSLTYYVYTKMVENRNGIYVLSDKEKLLPIINKMEQDLSSQLIVNLLT